MLLRFVTYEYGMEVRSGEPIFLLAGFCGRIYRFVPGSSLYWKKEGPWLLPGAFSIFVIIE